MTPKHKKSVKLLEALKSRLSLAIVHHSLPGSNMTDKLSLAMELNLEA
jgi:hypothetical protein